MIMKNMRLKIFGWGLFLLLALGLAACQSQTVEPTEAQVTISTQQNGEPQILPTESPSANEETTTDPGLIESHWQSSPHANTFVLDPIGQNNSCARCHAPINWLPSMDDLPESCFACKFELEEPPPYIPENEWVSIPCNVCHKTNKDDTIQPEIAWLEIAPLEEYTAVASPTELCLKCHAPIDIPEHGDVHVGGAHSGYECTACHSVHDTTTSCAAEACHSDVVESADPIPGHDADHQVVSCVACHDGSGMEVGLDADRGLWTTFATDSFEAGSANYAFTSHNIVLESRCDRCHFVDNPWALSTGVETP
jgi:hypothetical protein